MESRNDFDISLLTTCLDYNPESGELHWKISTGKSKAGKLAGCHSGRYLRVSLQGRTYSAHRIAWAIYYKEAPPSVVDHIDGNTLNNAISNLRAGTDCINQQNQKAAHKRNKSSSYLGVSKFNGMWRAKIYHNKKYIFLGYHPTEESARDAYIEAKKKLHAGYVE